MNCAITATSIRATSTGRGLAPCSQDCLRDLGHTHAVLRLSEYDRPRPAHGARISGHDIETCADVIGEIRLVDDEYIGLGNSGASFARHLVTTRNVDDIKSKVHELSAELRG